MDFVVYFLMNMHRSSQILLGILNSIRSILYVLNENVKNIPPKNQPKNLALFLTYGLIKNGRNNKGGNPLILVPNKFN